MARSPDQQLLTTQGEQDALHARIAELEGRGTPAPDTSAIARELDVANMQERASMRKQIDDLTMANTLLTSENTELKSKLEAIRADIAPAVQP